MRIAKFIRQLSYDKLVFKYLRLNKLFSKISQKTLKEYISFDFIILFIKIIKIFWSLSSLMTIDYFKFIKAYFYLNLPYAD